MTDNKEDDVFYTPNVSPRNDVGRFHSFSQQQRASGPQVARNIIESTVTLRQNAMLLSLGDNNGERVGGCKSHLLPFAQ